MKGGLHVLMYWEFRYGGVMDVCMHAGLWMMYACGLASRYAGVRVGVNGCMGVHMGMHGGMSVRMYVRMSVCI